MKHEPGRRPAGPPRPPFGRFAAILLVVSLLCSCGERSGRELAERRLYEFSRMAFVPAGATQRLPGDPRSAPVGGVERDLLVDRFEVSRADWRYWTGAPPAPDGLRVDAALHRSDRDAWPAYASFEESEAFARRRGLRLPSVGEWVHLASGGRGQSYPWGVLARDSVANTLELGLFRPVPVGTFENGRGPHGCYDLLGNVAEWAVPDGTPVVLRQGEVNGSTRAAALGGSYLRRLRPVLMADGGAVRVVGELLGREVRGPDLGLRCVVEAETFLLAHAAEWGSLPEAPARLRRIGRRFGSPAVRLLERLAGERPDLTALDWLLEGARG